MHSCHKLITCQTHMEAVTSLSCDTSPQDALDFNNESTFRLLWQPPQIVCCLLRQAEVHNLKSTLAN